MRKSLILLGVAGMAIGMATLTGCGKKQKKDEYEGDKLKITVRNLYFRDWSGGDRYLEEVENRFGVKFDELSSYSWGNWDRQVSSAINGSEMTDIFHGNIDSYNFGNLYKFWAEEHMIKPLPDDMSQWPNLEAMLNNLTNIDSLKLDGKLYGIPIAKNTTDYSTSFSPFTYIYRRDWAKKWGVYQENDEYTWDQFKALLEKFRVELGAQQRYAFADIDWGFPSITNFYKQVPHCFAQDSNGRYVNNYTTPEYLNGLDEAKAFKTAGWYHPDQNAASTIDFQKSYYSNQIGVLYENLSYENYLTIRNQLRANNYSDTSFNVDDATGIMKIKGPDGKYVLEGTDNWFSMTFFDNRISETKQYKILDVLNWLLGEEGTRFAIYGFENYDYTMVNGQPVIQEEYWPKDDDGYRARKDNGAKYLRYLVSLGYDTLQYDPLSQKDALERLNTWDAEMRTALNNQTLKVLKETKEVMWLTTPLKANNSGEMRTTALANAMKYVFGTDEKIKTRDDFVASFGSIWTDVLNEINTALNK